MYGFINILLFKACFYKSKNPSYKNIFTDPREKLNLVVELANAEK